MRMQLSDSQTQLMAEAGISWELKTEADTLTDFKVKIYSQIRMTAIGGNVKVTLDGLDSLVIMENDTFIFNVGLGDPEDTKHVKITTSGDVNMSVGIDSSRKRQQPSVE